METNYICPKCKSYLNIADKIVLSLKIKNKQEGLILFEKELGNYDVKKHDIIEYKKGDVLGFYCPICHENLAADDVNSNLAKIIMLDEKGKESEIVFSKVVGEHATYKLKENEIEIFGEDSDKYLNHFGHTPRY